MGRLVRRSANLLVVCHAQFSFAMWVHADSLGGNIAWYNVFNPANHDSDITSCVYVSCMHADVPNTEDSHLCDRSLQICGKTMQLNK